MTVRTEQLILRVVYVLSEPVIQAILCPWCGVMKVVDHDGAD